MSYAFKGFVSIRELINNESLKDNTIGEISTQCLTYTKDPQYYPADAAATVTLIQFSSKNTAGNLIAPTSVLRDAKNLATWVHGRQKAITASESKDFFKSLLAAEFTGLIKDIEVGDFVKTSLGNPYPSWIKWSSVDYNTDTNQNVLWFCNSSFAQQYDEYEIVVVPPIAPIDQFFAGYNAAKAVLGRASMTDLVNDMKAAKAGHPETTFSVENYNFVNVNNVADVTPTNWGFVYYGARGDDTDLVKQALINYIQKNSTRSVDQWKTIFPDIFKDTEFTILPRWSNVAIREVYGLVSGVNSSVANLSTEAAYAKRVLSAQYGEDFVAKNACIMAHPFRSLMLVICGSPENKSNKFSILSWYPDIIDVETSSPDFNRMDAATKEFLVHLANMLNTAMTMTDYSDLPIGYRRTLRNGITYISVTHRGVRILVGSLATTPA